MTAAQPLTIRASATSSWPECNLRSAVHSFPALFQEAGWELAPGRAGVGSLMGSAYHAGAHAALTEHMKGTRMPLATAQEAAIAMFRERLREEADGQPVIFSDEARTLADAELQCRRLLARWHADVLPETRPIAIENRLTALFRPGLMLSGQADLLHLDENPKAITVVRDHKTSRRRQVPMKHGPQLGCYSLLFRSRGYSTDVGQIDFAHVVRLSNPQPPIEPQPIDVIAAEQMAVAVLNQMGNAVEQFRKDGDAARFTCNPSTFLCSPKFCRAYGKPICPATFQP